MARYVIGQNQRAQRVGTATLLPGDPVPDDYVDALPAGARDRLMRAGIFVPNEGPASDTTSSGVPTKDALLDLIASYFEAEPEHAASVKEAVAAMPVTTADTPKPAVTVTASPAKHATTRKRP